MTSEGSLISFAADNDKDATIYSAISANIWNTYKKKNSDTYTNLQFQILHCDVRTDASFSFLYSNAKDMSFNLGGNCIYYRNRIYVVMSSWRIKSRFGYFEG
jgi:hypothetical protein